LVEYHHIAMASKFKKVYCLHPRIAYIKWIHCIRVRQRLMYSGSWN